MSDLHRFCGGTIRILCAFCVVVLSSSSLAAQAESRSCDGPGVTQAWADSAGVKCYWIHVPENRGTAGRSIRLAIAVASARVETPSEPILYLHGGPGLATLDGLRRRLASPTWSGIRETHDVVFMDYRGTGQSEPSWCDALESEIRQIDLENPQHDTRVTRIAAAFGICRGTLEAKGLDLAGYTSAAMAGDAEAARVALGLPQWNVYAVSFGTHVALSYARDYPDGLRALILDSTFPPNAQWLDVLRPFAAALDLLASRCSSAPKCVARFPDLQGSFKAAVAHLNANPLEVKIGTMGRTDLVDGTDFAWSIWTALLNPKHIPLVPLAVVAGETGDTAALTAWSQRFIDPDAFGANASAQYYAVWCFEGEPRAEEQTEAAAIRAHPQLANLIVKGLDEAVCRVWQPHRARAEAVSAVVSDVPTLILTGEFDPITRPSDGHIAAATLARSQVVDVDGASHAVLNTDSCTRELTASFLTAPTATVNATCLQARAPLEFLTDVTLIEALSAMRM